MSGYRCGDLSEMDGEMVMSNVTRMCPFCLSDIFVDESGECSTCGEKLQV